MKVLIGCERSGIIRDAFIKRGHDAWSCDLEKTDSPGPHIKDDIFKALKKKNWDLFIAHPPCTYLTITGSKWYYHPDDKDLPVIDRRPHPRFPNRLKHRTEAVNFFMKLMKSKVNKICIENPIGIMSRIFMKPSEIIHPWMFGHTVSKGTCLWLKNLPILEPTVLIKPEFITFKSGKRMSKWNVDISNKTHDMAERSKLRSESFPGIAKEMARLWG